MRTISSLTMRFIAVKVILNGFSRHWRKLVQRESYLQWCHIHRYMVNDNIGSSIQFSIMVKYVVNFQSWSYVV